MTDWAGIHGESVALDVEYYNAHHMAALASFPSADKIQELVESGISDFNSSTREDSNYSYQSIYRNIAGYSLLNLRLGVKRFGWTAGLFVANALDRHAETELPFSNGFDLPTQRRIALNRPGTIGVDIRFDY